MRLRDNMMKAQVVVDHLKAIPYSHQSHSLSLSTQQVVVKQHLFMPSQVQR